MRRTVVVSTLSTVAMGVLFATTAAASGFGRNQDNYRVELSGYDEVPAVVTDGNAELRLSINAAAGTISYQLGYDSLAGNVTQSHIHIGQPGVSGGVSMWLCQTTAAPAPASVASITPNCPGTTAGNVSGTLTAANVVGPTAQNVAVGDFGDVIAAIRAGKAYANVHTTVVTGGEIRGQIVH